MKDTLPTLEMPPALARAAQVRADRAADLTQAQQELRAARLAVETSIIEDRGDYASAMDAGRGDPGAVHEEAARREVLQAERREAGEALRLARADDDLAAAVTEHVDAWVAKVEKLWAKADGELLAALEKVEQVAAKRAEVLQVAAWLAGVQQTGDLSARQRRVSDETGLRDASSSGARLRVPQLVQALREHVEATSAEAHQEGAATRAAARQRDERLAKLRTHERADVRAAVSLIDVGELTEEDAEAVLRGASLEDVQELARRRRAAERPLPAWA